MSAIPKSIINKQFFIVIHSIFIVFVSVLDFDTVHSFFAKEIGQNAEQL